MKREVSFIGTSPAMTTLAARVLHNHLYQNQRIEISKERYSRPQANRYNAKYPWQQLEVGQSFFVRCYGPYKYKALNSLTSCRRNAQKTGKRFRTHLTVQGIRVWRTA